MLSFLNYEYRSMLTRNGSIKLKAMSSSTKHHLAGNSDTDNKIIPKVVLKKRRTRRSVVSSSISNRKHNPSITIKEPGGDDDDNNNRESIITSYHSIGSNQNTTSTIAPAPPLHKVIENVSTICTRRLITLDEVLSGSPEMRTDFVGSLRKFMNAKMNLETTVKFPQIKKEKLREDLPPPNKKGKNLIVPRDDGGAMEDIPEESFSDKYIKAEFSFLDKPENQASVEDMIVRMTKASKNEDDRELILSRVTNSGNYFFDSLVYVNEFSTNK